MVFIRPGKASARLFRLSENALIEVWRRRLAAPGCADYRRRCGRWITSRLAGGQSLKSAEVRPSEWPAGHWTSSIRLPSGSTTDDVKKSSVPSGRVGCSVSMPLPASWARVRSEEHTSELQSRQYLVC